MGLSKFLLPKCDYSNHIKIFWQCLFCSWGYFTIPTVSRFFQK